VTPMGNEDASWLKQVRAEEKKVPQWLVQIFEHPMFASLQHQHDGSWWIVTREEQEFNEPELNDVCRKFAEHYGLK